MKVWKMVLIVSLCFILVFGIVLIVLTIKKGAAEHHYDQNRETKEYEYSNKVYAYYGCGEKDCEFCNGEKHSMSYKKSTSLDLTDYYGTHINKATITKDERELFKEFYYYRVLFSFWVSSIVLTGVNCATAVASSVILIKKQKKKNIVD